MRGIDIYDVKFGYIQLSVSTNQNYMQLYLCCSIFFLVQRGKIMLLIQNYIHISVCLFKTVQHYNINTNCVTLKRVELKLLLANKKKMH